MEETRRLKVIDHLENAMVGEYLILKLNSAKNQLESNIRKIDSDREEYRLQKPDRRYMQEELNNKIEIIKWETSKIKLSWPKIRLVLYVLVFVICVILAASGFSVTEGMMLVPVALVVIVTSFPAKKERSKRQELQDSKIKSITEELELSFKREMDIYEHKFNELKKLEDDKIALFNEHIDKIEQQIRINKINLNEYYERDNILYPDYRNLKAVRRIHQYLSSQRVDDLTGRDGAYNLYENEIRLENIADTVNYLTKIVSYKLDRITMGLDTIASNQRVSNMLLSDIEQGIFSMSNMVNDNLSSIKNNQTLMLLEQASVDYD